MKGVLTEVRITWPDGHVSLRNVEDDDAAFCVETIAEEIRECEGEFIAGACHYAAQGIPFVVDVSDDNHADAYVFDILLKQRMPKWQQVE